ncbi:MAG: hypothetical protein IH863_00080 [Chloroflexi bacterium]|nr:hypothetical protein [Chloroflexota bacterium]
MSQTGPRTKRGKAASSRNAFKHGIQAGGVVIYGIEKHEEWEAIRDGIADSLQPDGVLENMLAERVALCLWKLRRLDRWQAVITRSSIDATDRDLHHSRTLAEAIRSGGLAKGEIPEIEISEDELMRAEFARIIPPKHNLDLIMRYESHLHRKYIQTLHELEAMQGRRQGAATPLARLDILGAPAG